MFAPRVRLTSWERKCLLTMSLERSSKTAIFTAERVAGLHCLVVNAFCKQNLQGNY